ncbi:hypothetical protein [Geothrix alkalitolerans]|uniref:hypothetical protein n=1 Tax=Geothrix alkalitolerans TaxID=2922724 RepID=UPI001FAEFE0B|nr:hypothetical protein [Geothrix alkalitolerans]
MRRLISALLLCAWALGFAQAQGPAPEAILALEPYRKTIALRATVGGMEGLFLFDTAGGLSLISPGFARKIGRQPWGRLTGHRMMGQRLDTPRCDDLEVKAGSLILKAPVVGILDIRALFPKDAAPVDGSLALDLFDGKAITLDFPGGRLIVETPASLEARVGNIRPLPLRLARELQGRALSANVGVPTAKGTVWMELDSGNGGTILVSKPYATLVGLDPDKEGPQQASFEVGPGLRAVGPAFTPDMILDGNLGMPFLKDKVVTLDLAAGRLWIVPNPAPPPH